ncbi:Fes1-domain-containing protein [Xylariomycetidae sp. FL0641]|nr:Fes1-domain-containing protein [Xylariomycetidae sp. FL0641]
MNPDKNLNELLKWSIENSTRSDPSAPASGQPGGRELNQEALASLLGGPSDAELMQSSMDAITSSDPQITLEDKLTAFDNMEQLIESLDNANLLSKLGLWTPLLECLGHEEADLRKMAAWCVGTAVQNNAQSQERLLALGGIEKLVDMALGRRATMDKRSGDGDVTTADGVAPQGSGGQDTETPDVRRKAVYALSSAVRNYQPAMDVAAKELEKNGEDVGKVDAHDMDAVNTVIDGLKSKATSGA